MNKSGGIYGLFDPRTHEIRYVGYSREPKERLKAHIKEARYRRGRINRRLSWVRCLLNEERTPTLVLLEACSPDTWADAERRWISDLRTGGADLTNGTDGGEGRVGAKHTEETKKKIGAWGKGRQISEKARQATIKRNRERVYTTEDRQRCSERLRNPSLETRAKLSAVARGKTASPETRAKMSAAHMGQVVSAENRAKASARKTAYWAAWRERNK